MEKRRWSNVGPFLVETRLKLVGGSSGEMGVRNVLKVSELNNTVNERATRRACIENMKCGEVERLRVCRRSEKNSEI